MTINKFVKNNLRTIQTDVIGNLKEIFSSHKFFQKFAKRFESDYIDFLANNKSRKGTFCNVHRQIALAISKKEESLNIKKTRRIRDENIFGDITENQEWEKI